MADSLRFEVADELRECTREDEDVEREWTAEDDDARTGTPKEFKSSDLPAMPPKLEYSGGDAERRKFKETSGS